MPRPCSTYHSAVSAAFQTPPRLRESRATLLVLLPAIRSLTPHVAHVPDRNGDGVQPDVAEAFHWLEQSAAAGSERAQFNAAVALDPLHPPWGKPGERQPEQAMVPKQPFQAVAYYQAAVAQGHAKAKVNLGIALYTGTGCDRDPAAAAALWREASADGVSQADFCLRNMEEKPGQMEDFFS
jgi:TPR repeat protein